VEPGVGVKGEEEGIKKLKKEKAEDDLAITTATTSSTMHHSHESIPVKHNIRSINKVTQQRVDLLL